MPRGVRKAKVELGHPRGVCDFCLKKGEEDRHDKTYRLRSRHRSYRFLNVCSKCLTRIRSGFRKKRK